MAKGTSRIALKGSRTIVSGGYLSDAELRDLLEICKKPALEWLTLRQVHLENDGAKRVAEALRQHCEIRKLLLPDNRFGDSACEAIADLLVSCAHLTMLVLSRNPGITDSGAACVLRSLRAAQSLQDLRLCEIVIRGESATALASLLESTTALSKLHLDGCGIRSREGVVIFQALGKNRSVTQLSLRGNCLCVAGAKYLGAALRSGCVVQDLFVSENGIRDGADALLAGLAASKHIRLVDLASNSIGADAAGALCKLLHATKTLQTLDISDNKIFRDGAQEFAAGIRECATLRELYAYRTKLEGDSALAVCSALRNKPDLRSVDISYNALGALGVAELVKAFVESKHLEVLDLKGSEISDTEVRCIAQTLPLMPNIKELILDQNKITSNGLRILSAALPGCDKLQTLKLESNRIGPLGYCHLFDALVSNSSVTTVRISPTVGVSQKVGKLLALMDSCALRVKNTITKAISAKENRTQAAEAATVCHNEYRRAFGRRLAAHIHSCDSSDSALPPSSYKESPNSSSTENMGIEMEDMISCAGSFSELPFPRFVDGWLRLGVLDNVKEGEWPWLFSLRPEMESAINVLAALNKKRQFADKNIVKSVSLGTLQQGVNPTLQEIEKIRSRQVDAARKSAPRSEAGIPLLRSVATTLSCLDGENTKIAVSDAFLSGWDILHVLDRVYDGECVEELVLNHAPLGPLGGFLMGRSLQEPQAHLRRLSLAHTYLGDFGACKVASTLAKFSQIESIDLSDNGLTDRCIEVIAKMLGAVSSLRRIVLASNFLTDASASHLISVVVCNPSLVEINVDENLFTARGLDSIAAIAQRMGMAPRGEHGAAATVQPIVESFESVPPSAQCQGTAVQAVALASVDGKVDRSGSAGDPAAESLSASRKMPLGTATMRDGEGYSQTGVSARAAKRPRTSVATSIAQLRSVVERADRSSSEQLTRTDSPHRADSSSCAAPGSAATHAALPQVHGRGPMALQSGALSTGAQLQEHEAANGVHQGDISAAQVREWIAAGQCLGRGSTGNMFATNMDGEAVAIKATMGHGISKRTVAEVKDEIAILNALNPHPNVLMFHKSCVDASGIAFVFPLCQKLEDACFEALQRKDWKVVYTYLSEIAQGLCELHLNGFELRDLRPCRLLVLGDGRRGRAVVSGIRTPKLRSLLARVQQGFEASATRAGVEAKRYKAPEQLVSATQRKFGISVKSDMWAFGLLVNEILTGAAPYAELDETDVERLLTEEVASGHYVPVPHGALPQEVRNFVQKCLSYVPFPRPSAKAAADFFAAQAALCGGRP